MKNFYIKDIKISCCNLISSVNETISYMQLSGPNYICVTDAGNLVNAHRKFPELKEAINNSFLSLPDGKPISILAKLKGVKDIGRVAGPDFMDRMFKETSGTKLKHYFLGDTEEIHKILISQISGKYDLQIAGSFEPEFGKWDLHTNEEIINKINESGADIIWVSLGGGKQEVWMKNNYKKLNKGIMIGVGAAFRFYTGKIKRAPSLLQSLGLEWFFRLVQQPRKMFGRYVTTLPFFLIYSIQEAFRSGNSVK